MLVSVYRKADGRFTGETLNLDLADILANIREGFDFKEGYHDHRVRVVDVSTGVVVSCEPLAVSQEEAESDARAAIAALERRTLRPLAEIQLAELQADADKKAAAAAVLAMLRAQIDELATPLRK